MAATVGRLLRVACEPSDQIRHASNRVLHWNLFLESALVSVRTTLSSETRKSSFSLMGSNASENLRNAAGT